MNNELLAKLATKEEVELTRKQLETKIEVTKQELLDKIAKMATKEELNSTKQELLDKMAQLATKEELKAVKQTVDRLTVQVLENTEAIKNMVTRKEFNETLGKVLAGQDKLIKFLEEWRQEQLATDHALRRIEDKLEQEALKNEKQDVQIEDHEKRISILEQEAV
ncbi:MAG: hypothetical protein ONB05_05250 [candidate division KSB1 bacterium]|nr:hypothetical protein [candidate division KSB1 bacterium]